MAIEVVSTKTKMNIDFLRNNNLVIEQSQSSEFYFCWSTFEIHILCSIASSSYFF